MVCTYAKLKRVPQPAKDIPPTIKYNVMLAPQDYKKMFIAKSDK